MKAVDRYFPVVLFTTTYKVALSRSFYVCGFYPEMLFFKMKATELYFPLLPSFNILFKAVLTFEPLR